MASIHDQFFTGHSNLYGCYFTRDNSILHIYPHGGRFELHYDKSRINQGAHTYYSAPPIAVFDELEPAMAALLLMGEP